MTSVAPMHGMPYDWGVSSVGEEFDVQLGKMLDAARNAGILKPFIGNRAVQWGRIAVDGLAVVPMTPADILKYRLERGDLMVCEGGEIGRAAVWDAPIAECYFQKALHRLRPKRGFEPALLMYLLRLWTTNGDLDQFTTRTSIAHLPKEKLELIPIPVPPPEEQRSIVACLSDVDHLLGAIELVVAKKRAIRDGAMQQLLTGSTRLAGYTGEWELERFGDCATPRSDRIDPQGGDVGMFCIELEHVEPSTGRLLGGSSTGLDTSQKTVFDAGDVLFGKLRAYLRKFWLADRPGVCSTEFWALTPRPNKLSSEYLLQLVKTDGFAEAASLAYGTHMPRSDWRVVREFTFPRPPIDEQRSIAAVLLDMDSEIAALETRSRKLQLIKQGMMQALLSGRIRLPASDEAAA